MAQIAILERKCDGCGRCVERCPFDGIALEQGRARLTEGCRQCGACVPACPRQAILRLEARASGADKSAWRGVLVIAEQAEGGLHPVSLELIGKGRELLQSTDQQVRAAVMGARVRAEARELLHYGVAEVYAYEHAELEGFRAEAYAACCADAIRIAKPSVVLIGATALGRSLAPRLATRFHTGLTADCTKLELRGGADLVQIRPAFGGNIMAQIITPDSRPQFATVRYRVMDAPERSAEPSGTVILRDLPAFESAARFLGASPLPPCADISAADALVVAGRGLRREADLAMIQELAGLLGADWAVSRPLAEMGWAEPTRQIGLSGRTVRPGLLIACGVSGAIQFTACMRQSGYIVAIDRNGDAPIFQAAHLGLVGDLYQIVPELIAALKASKHQSIKKHQSIN